ncbi:MAG: glycosyltransferase family 2 protein [Gammaproteobacteria bacterium]
MMHLVRRFLHRPKLSVVVIVFDMAREAPRTLHSLSVSYQRGVSDDDYEVIVVDNGSPTPLGESVVQKYGRHFRYVYIQDASPSPAGAVNTGVRLSRGEYVCIAIDGARILTPGLIRTTLRAFNAYDDPAIATLGWHLGSEPQQRSVRNGYTKSAEDALLKKIDWPLDGYRLFEIGCLGMSSEYGCFSPISESNTLTVSRDAFELLGGLDTRFDLPGGGLVNLDFFRRACERPGSQLVMLAGEGSFHQLHGGASTNIPSEELDSKFKEWTAQYTRIRGIPWEMPKQDPEYLGVFPLAALPYIAWSANQCLEMKSKALD